MAPRPKHSRPELEAILRVAESKGWRITGGGNTYFKMKCPCDDKHLKMVHLSPNRNYHKRLERWLERRACWDND